MIHGLDVVVEIIQVLHRATHRFNNRTLITDLADYTPVRLQVYALTTCSLQA
jgi:hypothetical protein